MRRPGCFKSAAAKLEAMAKPHYLDELDAAKNIGYRSHMPSKHTTTVH